MAFAFSILLYPHLYQLILRLAFPMGEIRAYHVPREYQNGTGLAFSPAALVSAAKESEAFAPYRVPFGPSLSASLACCG